MGSSEEQLSGWRPGVGLPAPAAVAVNDRVQYYCLLGCFAVAAFGFATATYGLFMLPRVYELPVAMQINSFAQPMMSLIVAWNIWTERLRRRLQRDRRSISATVYLVAALVCFSVAAMAFAWKWHVVGAWGPALMLAGGLCLVGEIWLHFRPEDGADANRRASA